MALVIAQKSGKLQRLQRLLNQVQFDDKTNDDIWYIINKINHNIT